jgi:hypothetical protein
VRRRDVKFAEGNALRFEVELDGRSAFGGEVTGKNTVGKVVVEKMWRGERDSVV